MMIRQTCILSFLFLSLIGCGQTVEEPVVEQPVAEQSAVKTEISWFEGSVEEGFAQASASGKPVYLYWGAIWCPPCQEIKHTVFKSREFIAQTELFVPIYLDGDTEQAQAWGEKFDVQGYPTMIVFSPAGEELTRIPGGIDISKYNTVLSMSLESMKPTSTLVAAALEDPASLDPRHFTQLAYYSWGQDAGALPEGTPADFFRRVSEAAEDSEASARLYMQYLIALSEQQADSPDSPILADGVPERLGEILSSTQLTLACWDSLAYWSEEVMSLPVFTEVQKEKVMQQWADQLYSLRNQESLSVEDKLASWIPGITFHFMDTEEPLSDEMIVELRAELQEVDQSTTNSFTRQSVVNQIRYVYQSAKLYDDARSVLLSALNKASSPYYFMSSLSSLAEQEEKFDEAIEWRQKAYEESDGAATRFQWGANYVKALIRMTPDNHELIVTTSMGLFDDLQANEELFAGRNFRVLSSLSESLEEWKANQETEALTRSFIARMHSVCDEQLEDSLERENCKALLEV